MIPVYAVWHLPYSPCITGTGVVLSELHPRACVSPQSITSAEARSTSCESCPKAALRLVWCAGPIAVGRVLRDAVAAASGVVAALAERLAGLLPTSQEPVQPQLSDVPETVRQLAIVTGKLDHEWGTAFTLLSFHPCTG